MRTLRKIEVLLYIFTRIIEFLLYFNCFYFKTKQNFYTNYINKNKKKSISYRILKMLVKKLTECSVV